jgi:hypothetical protein
MRFTGAAAIVFALTMAAAISGYAPATQAEQTRGTSGRDGEQPLRDGQTIFRFDRFGDEQLWTDVLRMHEVIPAVDPVTALAVGLTVDVAAPPTIYASVSVDALLSGETRGSAKSLRPGAAGSIVTERPRQNDRRG